MIQEEIKDIMESCFWCEHPPGDGAVCTRFFGTIVPCDGACSYVVDHLKLKEEINYDRQRIIRQDNKSYRRCHKTQNGE